MNLEKFHLEILCNHRQMFSLQVIENTLEFLWEVILSDSTQGANPYPKHPQFASPQAPKASYSYCCSGLAGSVRLEAAVGNQLLWVLFCQVLVSVCVWVSCQFIVLLEPWTGSKRLFTVMDYLLFL